MNSPRLRPPRPGRRYLSLGPHLDAPWPSLRTHTALALITSQPRTDALQAHMGQGLAKGGGSALVVVLERPFFHAGDIVRGVVCLQVAERLETAGLELKAGWTGAAWCCRGRLALQVRKGALGS